MMQKYFCVAIGLILSGLTAQAQTTENGGWFFLSHTQKISDKFNFLADVQLRTADKYEYLNTLLLRGGLSYNFSKKHSVAVGYTYKGDWEKQDGEKQFMREHRAYEQYLYKFKLKKVELNVRARLEQRFVRDDGIAFSQRARAFISAQIPVVANSDFSKGLYAAVQNELFVNVQHKERVNNHFFDQNRPYGSVGYRWSKKIDTEVGYMYWFQKEDDGDYRRNIFQLMVTTNF